MTSTLFYSAMVMAAGWLGASIPVMVHRKTDSRFLRLFISFGAGVLLGAAFLHLIPDSVESLGKSMGFWLLGGFLALYLLEVFTPSHPCEEDHAHYHKIGWVAFIGLSVHNLMNGVALGAAVSVPALGLVVFIATLAHKAPEYFSLSTLLLAGKRRKSHVAFLIIFVSLMIPAGAILSRLFLYQGTTVVVGAALAFSAGTFIHIALVDLEPEIHHQGAWKHFHLTAFLLGLALMALATRWE